MNNLGIAPEVFGMAILAWLVLPAIGRYQQKRMIRKAYEARQALRRVQHFERLKDSVHEDE
jgi:hypothetical protein